MIRTFEDEILLYFMNFQKMFRLEELQIVRENYVKYERDMYKRHKIAAVTLMTLMTITFILVLVFSPANFTQLMPESYRSRAGDYLFSAVQFGGFLICLQMYFWTNVKLSYRMRRFHRHEFNQHALRMISLQVCTSIAILYKVLRSFLWEYRWYCETATIDMRVTREQLNPDSICA